MVDAYCCLSYLILAPGGPPPDCAIPIATLDQPVLQISLTNSPNEITIRTDSNSIRKVPAMRRLLISFIVLGLLWVSVPQPRSQTQTFHPVVRGRRGVVAGGHPLSVEAGLRILQHGGNAVDAGVATILAASVIEFSHFSFGGEVPILIKLRDSNVVVVEGMGQAPLKATREFFVNRTKSASEGAATAPDSSRAQ